MRAQQTEQPSAAVQLSVDEIVARLGRGRRLVVLGEESFEHDGGAAHAARVGGRVV